MAKEPMNPKAGVSGPGEKSKRTDLLRMGSIAYGEGIDTQAIKSAIPLSKTPDVRGATNTQVRQAAGQKAERLAGLYDQTQRPNEPITSGVDIGDGPGSKALGYNQKVQNENQDKDFLAQYLPILDTMAQSPDSPETFRVFVRSIQSLL